jgi:hypothetical protein
MQRKSVSEYIFHPWDDPITSSTWCWAFVTSLLITLVCIVALGILYIPHELKELSDKQGNRIKWLTPVPNSNSFVALVESVGRIRETYLRLYDLSGKNIEHVDFCTTLGPESFSFSAHGTRLFVGNAKSRVFEAQVRSAVPPDAWNWVQRPGGCWNISCSKDDKTLMMLDGNGLQAWNIEDRANEFKSPRWIICNLTIRSFAIACDSITAIFVCGDSQGSCLYEVNLLTGKYHLKRFIANYCLDRLLLSPDGSFLAALDEQGSIVLFHRKVTEELFEPYEIAGLRTGENQVCTFSSDSTFLMVNDPGCHQLIAWDLTAKKETRRFATHPTRIIGCTVLNCDEVISWSHDEWLRIWRLDTDTPTRQLRL